MAYKVIRVPYVTNLMVNKFKDAEDDTDFTARSYPELDDYLSMMETRGWTVIDTVTDGQLALFITLHQPDTILLGTQTA